MRRRPCLSNGKMVEGSVALDQFLSLRVQQPQAGLCLYAADARDGRVTGLGRGCDLVANFWRGREAQLVVVAAGQRALPDQLLILRQAGRQQRA